MFNLMITFKKIKSIVNEFNLNAILLQKCVEKINFLSVLL